MLLVTAFAGQWPSLFRGVVVADSPLGVRVVSVAEQEQAFLADLRPDDIIVSVDGNELHSIDQFAALSNTLKGRTVSAHVLIFRNGLPHELTLHLYSYPILRTWGITFLPDHDLRFAQPDIGLAYWRRLGRGFQEAGKTPNALHAYLNGLHNVPADVPTALAVTELSFRVSQQHLEARQLSEGIAALGQGVHVMERIFDYPLSEQQLTALRDQLAQTLAALRATTRGSHPATSY